MAISWARPAAEAMPVAPQPEPDAPDAGPDVGPVGPTTPRMSRAWLALGLAVLGAYFLLPRAGVAQAVLLCGLCAANAVAAVAAVRRAHGRSRLVWMFFAAFSALSAIANIPDYGYSLMTGQPIPVPSAVDVMWLATYPCFTLAVLALARMRRDEDHAGNLLDALIIVVGGGVLMWAFLIAPVTGSTGMTPLAHTVSVLYPVMDLVMFAGIVRLLVGSWGSAAVRLLTASAMSTLLGDVFYATDLAGGNYLEGGPSDGLWMLAYVLAGAAALHPSARSFSGPSAVNHRMTPGRLVFLGAALVSGPVLLVAGVDANTTVVASLSLATFVLVMARMAMLNAHLARARTAVELKTDELRHQALHDALTGLPNRVLILDRIEQMLVRSRRHGTTGAVLFVDLDGFKNVNDTFGHEVGDRLLQDVATRLTASLRELDTVARMGGDEFVVLIEEVTLDCAPELVAERIRDVLRQPFELDVEVPIVISASIGVAAGLRASPSDLLRDADVALYQAKASGRNRYDIFRPEMKTAIQRRYELEFELRNALADDQFRLVYQPIYNLDYLDVVGFEALLRWDHPTLEQISPAEFVPVLESTGQIVEVGSWVLQKACAQIAQWRSAGRDVIVSVNVSGRQLDRDDIVGVVRDALHASGLDPSALTLEITETMLMRNIDATADRLRVLKSLGVQIAIDDFGTGYSSLACLQRLPVDCLKLDRTFTEAISRSPASDALVHTLVQLGKDLGLRTLAEGVETTAQIDYLRNECVNEVQGYLLARPLTVEAVEQHILSADAKKPLQKQTGLVG